MKRIFKPGLSAIIWAVAWLAAWPGLAMSGEGEDFVYQQLAETRTACRQRLKLGAAALAVLEDRNATPLAKTCAALAIGELGYIQAIPVLIEQIDLKSALRLADEAAGIGNHWPCVQGLAGLGVAAVPALVEAYAAEKQEARRELFKDAIIFCKAYPEAKTYTQGLLAATKDPARRAALEKLLKLIPDKP